MPSGLCLSARLPGLVAGSFLTRREQPSSLTPGRGALPRTLGTASGTSRPAAVEKAAGGEPGRWTGREGEPGSGKGKPCRLVRSSGLLSWARGRQAPPDGPAAGGRADRSGVLWNCPAARALRRCHGHFSLRALWGPHCVG